MYSINCKLDQCIHMFSFEPDVLSSYYGSQRSCTWALKFGIWQLASILKSLDTFCNLCGMFLESW